MGEIKVLNGTKGGLNCTSLRVSTAQYSKGL